MVRDDYTCPRCGYQTRKRFCMNRHLYELSKVCPGQRNNIELTDEVKQHILNNRVYNPSSSSIQIAYFKPENVSGVISGKVVLQPLQNISTLNPKTSNPLPATNTTINDICKNEYFYQKLLEDIVKGEHKKLKCGITDITTDISHIEIKQWKSYMAGIGQLLCYNTEDPKEELYLYLFGKRTDKLKKLVLLHCEEFNIIPFAMSYTDNVLTIRKVNDDTIVYSKNVLEKD
jgi:hypothetical protein